MANQNFRTLTLEDYTIGWICALTEEFVAAKLMLDETHPTLPVHPNDTNTYKLGSIGEHNIVIACLPEAGANQAATVATWMASSFPNVKIGLMVGIGGGIPSKVSLGDIVVSTPVDQYPGVVQHDFGKELDGTFKRTGALNKPPTVLLTALRSLRSKHTICRFSIHKRLNDLRESRPGLEPAYTRRPTVYPALTNSQTNSDNPQVHYGLIASGNRVIKSAVARDTLDYSLGGQVLCIEMEAAGLMDNFPCIVIRGICDYADANKNDDWHGYAAMAAAIYAKELMEKIRPVEVQKEIPIKEILRRQGRMIQEVHKNTTNVRSILSYEEIFKFLDHITPIRHGLQHSSISNKRQPDTGQWFLETPEYRHWLIQNKEVLHCTGIPGVGKTFLASRVIDHLVSLCCDPARPEPSLLDEELEATTETKEKSRIGIAYVYCDYRQAMEQTALNILTSLMVQLVHQSLPSTEDDSDPNDGPSLPSAVEALRQEYRRYGLIPSIDKIAKAIKSMATTTFSRVYIVIDALDECETSAHDRQDLLRHIFRLRAEANINIFATSKHVPVIMQQLESEGCCKLEVRAHDEDLQKYLSSQVMRSGSAMLQDHYKTIEASIIKAADGIFLLAQLHFESIVNKTSPGQLKNTLKSLATGDGAYLATYGNIMERINIQNPDFVTLAYRVLTWVICAETPLTILQLRQALSLEQTLGGDRIGLDTTYFPEVDLSNCPDINTMISVCAGLITIVDEDVFSRGGRTIRLVHSTAQDFFHQVWDFDKAHTSIGKTCIKYLVRSYPRSPTAIDPCSLRYYAMAHWGNHVSKSPDTILGSMAFEMLQNDAILTALGSSVFETKSFTRLHVAAYFGLTVCAELLLQMGSDPDAIGDESYGESPLWWATTKGHLAIVELLLNNGANPNIVTRSGSTPLSQAAAGGQTRMAKLLIHSGADIHARNTFGETILSSIAGTGLTSLVKLLLNQGADPNTQDIYGKTPLLTASKYGNVSIMKLLLDAGADINTAEIRGITPLMRAVMADSLEAVTLLVDNGANQFVHDKWCNTAYSWAVSLERRRILEYLFNPYSVGVTNLMM
ncbi:hypothetical protein TWF730_002023 [Orbilia blumenaviensis]|uniref:Ankyrin repeat protein n=1 Tax=Orbilia blumenaviensis TaxID=1796055 RepID=A0AAV9UGG2_9PEZI